MSLGLPAWRWARQLPKQLLKLLIFPLLLGCVLEQGGGKLLTWTAWMMSGADAEPLLLREEVMLPLKTRGKEIVDSQGKRVRLRCVNWYGAHMQNMVVGGLHKQPLRSLVRSIQALGFNCVRLPYSLEMHLRSAKAFPPKAAVTANPHFMNMTVLEIFDATIEALAAARIMVIVNNHQGSAMWCCSEDDGEGLWFSKDYPEEDWVRSLQLLARRYQKEPYVIGYDLRNEPRAIPAEVARSLQLSPQGRYLAPEWSSGDANWAAAALRAALAVSEEEPSTLIFVEGLDFATDLRDVAKAPLHRDARLRHRVVYEVHDYCWYHSVFFHSWQIYWLALGWLISAIFELRGGKSKVSSEEKEGPGAPASKKKLFLALLAMVVSNWMVSYSSFRAKLDNRWGYLLDQDEAPIWLGEFGTNGYWTTAVWWMEVGEVLWLKHLLRYVRERELGYAYWALNGDKLPGDDETFGLLDQDYASLRHPWLLPLLP